MVLFAVQCSQAITIVLFDFLRPNPSLSSTFSSHFTSFFSFGFFRRIETHLGVSCSGKNDLEIKRFKSELYTYTLHGSLCGIILAITLHDVRTSIASL